MKGKCIYSKLMAHPVAAQTPTNGHLPPQYMDSSIQPKDENWFLRMCHYTAIGVYHSPLCY